MSYGYYISQAGLYYEGDRQNPADQTVTQRPDSSYNWNGSAWVQSAAGVQAATFNAAVSAGFDTGLGWRLPFDANSRALLAQGAALILTEVQSLQLAGNSAGVTAFLASNYTFVDVTGAPHTVTVSQALSINLAYGQAYQQIWTAAQ